MFLLDSKDTEINILKSKLKVPQTEHVESRELITAQEEKPALTLENGKLGDKMFQMAKII
jgi:hypothetical protein